jgi:hypothetical protein
MRQAAFKYRYILYKLHDKAAVLMPSALVQLVLSDNTACATGSSCHDNINFDVLGPHTPMFSVIVLLLDVHPQK